MDVGVEVVDPHHVHVHFNSKRVIVSSDDEISAVSVDRPSIAPGNAWLWIATKNGQFHRLVVDDKEACNAGGSDIFKDLLTSSQLDESKNESMSRVFLGDKTLLNSSHKCEVVHMCCHGNIVAMVTKSKTACTVMLYEAEIGSHGNNLHLIWQGDVSGGDLEQIYATKLCFVSADDENSFVYSDDRSNNLRIKSDIFCSLFGKDALLLNSSILVMCDSKGRVYYKRLKCLKKIAAGMTILCDVGSKVIGLHGLVIPEKLCESSQVHDSSPAEKNCLAVVSERGKCLLIYTNDVKSEIRSLVFQPLVFFSQISSSCCDGENLFYSTRSDTFRVTPKRSVNSAHLTFDFDSLPLGYSGMKSLFWVYKKHCGNSQAMCLHGQSESKRVYHINTSATNKDCKSSVSPRLKDLLVGLNQTEAVLRSHDERIDELDCFLRQLSLASHLTMEFCSDQSNITNIAPQNRILDLVKCEVKCRYEDMGSRQGYFIVCTLTNESPASFTNGWNYVARLTIYNDLKRRTIQKTRSKTTSLAKSFSTTQFETLQFDLDLCLLAQPVLTVDTYLTLNVSVLPKSNNISVPLKHVSFDVINFLRLTKPIHAFNQSNPCINLTDLSPDEIIKMMSEERKGPIHSQISTKTYNNEVFSTSVCLSGNVSLPTILSDSLTPPTGSSQYRMCTPRDDVISFEVSSDDDGPKLIMRSTDLSLLCQIRQNIADRSASKGINRESLAKNFPRETVKQIQELQFALSAFRARFSSAPDAGNWSDFRAEITKIYTSLRSHSF